MKDNVSMIFRRRHWFVIGVIVIALLFAVADMPVDAAPDNQTVPLPTATSEPAPRPTATPSNDDDDSDDDDGDDDNDSSAPTPTPEPVPPADSGGDIAEAIDDPVDVVDGDIVGDIEGEVVVTRLNVREEPNAGAALIGQLSSGERVALLGRNEAGDWWVVCCDGETGQPGWVSAQFIQPNIRRVDVNNALVVSVNLQELLTADANVAVAEEDSAQALLRLAIEQNPAYVRQGGEIVLRLTVSNDGEVEARNVTLTDELSTAFSFESVSVENDGTSQQVSGNNDAVIIQIDWPSIAPGESAAADLTLRLVSNLDNGIVLDNLAVVSADNAEDESGGISIGTAPSLLPDF